MGVWGNCMLRASSLRVRYNVSDQDLALDGISFDLAPGERVAVLGANGAGKSTLLLTAVGLLWPQAGAFFFEGQALTKKNMPQIRQKLGLLWQNPDDQLFLPTVYEDIAFGLRNYGLREEEIVRRIDDVLEQLDISHLRDRLSHNLSGGEKRLAALAGILVMEPAILLLDEPSSFLDPRSRRRLIEILANLSQAILIASHDLDLVLKLCPRTLLLKQGRLMADGLTRELLGDEGLLEECGL